MGCEQIDAIKTGTNKIARLKIRVGQDGTELQPVSHAFNKLFGVNNNNGQVGTTTMASNGTTMDVATSFDWHWKQQKQLLLFSHWHNTASRASRHNRCLRPQKRQGMSHG